MDQLLLASTFINYVESSISFETEAFIRHKKRTMATPVPTIIDHYSLERGPGTNTVTRGFPCLRVIRPKFDRTSDMTLKLAEKYDPNTYKNVYEFDVPHLLMHLTDNGLPSSGFDWPIFFASRGMIKRLMLSSHSKEENESTFIAQKFQGAIFGRQTGEGWESMHPNALKGAYAGEFFEEAATEAYSHAHRPQGSGIGEFRDHFYCVFANKIGKFSIIYSGEMDALKSQESDPHVCENYIELKTKNINLLYPHNQHRLKDAIRDLWAQCVLSGIKVAVVGYRDADFICQKIVKYQVDQLPSVFGFDGSTYFKELESFLSHVHSSMRFDADDTIRLFSTRSIRANSDEYKNYSFLDEKLKDRLRSSSSRK